MNLIETYRKHFLLFESILALVITAVLISILRLNVIATKSFILDKGMIIFPILTIVSFVLFGFVLTSITIILSLFRIPDSRLQFLKGRPQYIQVFNIYFFSIVCLVGNGIASFLVIILAPDTTTFLFYLILWMTILSGFALYRCVWALYHIVKISNIKIEQEKSLQQ